MKLPYSEEPLSKAQAFEIAVEAFIYFYPLVTMEVARRQMTNVPSGKIDGLAPANSFAHLRTFPDAKFKYLMRVNFDSLLSQAWVDLSEEPVIISLPDTLGRYYLLAMIDMWSDVFAAPGWRTTGTKPKTFALVKRDWKGTLPENVDPIEAPTPYVWLIGRIKTAGARDYQAVHALQDAMKIAPLSKWGSTDSAPTVNADSGIDMHKSPLEVVNAMTAEQFFAMAAELMKLHQPHATDWSVLSRIRRLGIIPDKSFSFEALNENAKHVLSTAVDTARKLIADKIRTMGPQVNGWQIGIDCMGVYGNYYLRRAVVALGGIGASQPEDTTYMISFVDSDGNPLRGEDKYVVHFKYRGLPPVKGLWSITMYDADGLPCANAINRFAIFSWMPLQYNDDGSLDIYLQRESPSLDKETNWLPSPRQGNLGITLRLYAPEFSVLTGDWNPPAIRKLN